MKIEKYIDFVNFFDEYPREKDTVYTVNQNGQGKKGWRGKGYQVVVEEDEWDINELKNYMEVIFSSLSGQWDGNREDWIVGLIIDEISEIDSEYYNNLTDENWFNTNISNDYSCIQDYYMDFFYDEKKYCNEILSGNFESYAEYIKYLAKELLQDLRGIEK